MGFQALFKFVKCWRAPDIASETVPSSWGGDGERALAEFQTSARGEQSAVSVVRGRLGLTHQSASNLQGC